MVRTVQYKLSWGKYETKRRYRAFCAGQIGNQLLGVETEINFNAKHAVQIA